MPYEELVRHKLRLDAEVSMLSATIRLRDEEQAANLVRIEYLEAQVERMKEGHEKAVHAFTDAIEGMGEFSGLRKKKKKE